MSLPPRFVANVDQAVDTLRTRLLADVEAVANNGPCRGGIRREWRVLVQRLVVFKNTRPPAPQTPAAPSRHLRA